MKTNISLLTLTTLLIVSCNNKPKATSENKRVNETTQQIEQVMTNKEITSSENPKKQKVKTVYILQKITNTSSQNENKDDLIYEGKQGEYELSFQTKRSISYGVLRKESNKTGEYAYYVFNKPKNLSNELTINLVDALFFKTNKEIDPERAEWSDFHDLLKNYIMVGFRGPRDGCYSDYAIINVTTKKILAFGTASDYKFSEDEKFLIGWKESKKKIDPKTICPKKKEESKYFGVIIIEEFKLNLATGEETLTGKIDCGFTQ